MWDIEIFDHYDGCKVLIYIDGQPAFINGTAKNDDNSADLVDVTVGDKIIVENDEGIWLAMVTKNNKWSVSKFIDKAGNSPLDIL